MSLRRRSCEACYKRKRKCDFTFPSCRRCQKSHKICHYPDSAISNPIIHTNLFPDGILAETNASTAATCGLDDGGFGAHINDINEPLTTAMLNATTEAKQPLTPSPNMIGDLGQVQLLAKSDATWDWLLRELEQCPRQYALTAETVFINRDMNRDQTPKALRPVSAICASYTAGLDMPTTYQTLNAEVMELLKPVSKPTLSEDLSKLQALLLYQIIELHHGDVMQQTFSQEHGNILKSWGLQILQRADTELELLPRTRQTWLLGESVRRVVVTTFLLHAIHSVLKYGRCLEIPMLAALPVSIDSFLWNVSAVEATDIDAHWGETNKYTDFANLRSRSSCLHQDPFEKLLMVACKGIEEIDMPSA